jgi:hypothetical protein
MRVESEHTKTAESLPKHSPTPIITAWSAKAKEMLVAVVVVVGRIGTPVSVVVKML